MAIIKKFNRALENVELDPDERRPPTPDPEDIDDDMMNASSDDQQSQACLRSQVEADQKEQDAAINELESAM